MSNKALNTPFELKYFKYFKVSKKTIKRVSKNDSVTLCNKSSTAVKVNSTLHDIL